MPFKKQRHDGWAGRLGLALFLAIGAQNAAWAAETSDELMQKAAQAFRQGMPEEALTIVDRALKQDSGNASIHAFRGSLHSELGRSTNAIADFDAALKLDAAAAAIYQRRGVEHFKLGHIEKSIADFDAFLERVPAQEPYHWQRGISYYYAGRFADGRRQFEIHQTVNRQDVENAVWHFLCVARASGLEDARAQLIPIAGDSRVPMKQVHELFGGRATPQDVLQAAEEGEVSAEARQRNRFYAHLYLGLYFEAKREDDKAREHIARAAELSKDQDYMGAVARVHAARLEAASRQER